MLALAPNAWSPEGPTLFFTEVSGSADADIGVLDLETGDAEILIDDDGQSDQAALSPDGHWLAYRSNFSGENQVYAVRYPELSGRQLISTGGGLDPVWSPNGTELFYRSPDGRQVLSVPITTEPTLTPGTPTVVFEGQFLAGFAGQRSFDVEPGGEQFVAIRLGDVAGGGEGAEPSSTILVQNWFEELQRLVPTDR